MERGEKISMALANSGNQNSSANILRKTPSPYSETPELSSQSRVQSFNKDESNGGLDKMNLAEFEVCVLSIFGSLCIYVRIIFFYGESYVCNWAS